MSPGAGDARLTITPDGRAFRRGLAVRAAVMVPLIAVGVLGSRRGSVPAGVTWSIVGLGAVIAVVAIAMTITRVQVTATDLRVRRLIGAERVVPLGAVAGSVLARQYEQFGNAVAPLLTVLGQGRRRLLRLSGQVYAPDALAALSSVLGNATVIAEPVTPKLLEQRHPGLVPGYERKPFLVAGIVVAVVVVVGVVVGVSAQSGGS